MNEQQQAYPPPVPADKHYSALKAAEDSIKDRLSELEYSPLLVGLGVSYDREASTPDSSTLPHKMEFGYVEALDCAMEGDEIELTEEEWMEKTKGTLANHPLPIEYLDHLYERTKASLQDAAGENLVIAVRAVLYGSPLMGYSVGCLCLVSGQKKKKYCYYDKKNQKTVCYCSSSNC